MHVDYELEIYVENFYNTLTLNQFIEQKRFKIKINMNCIIFTKGLLNYLVEKKIILLLCLNNKELKVRFMYIRNNAYIFFC